MTDLVERLRFLASGQDDVHSQAIADAAAEIEMLRAWVKHAGLVRDICTRNALGEVCENCRCNGAFKRAALEKLGR